LHSAAHNGTRKIKYFQSCDAPQAYTQKKTPRIISAGEERERDVHCNKAPCPLKPFIIHV
jgi:hypothetical protein